MRTALVTGASRGIGAAVARQLAAEGYVLTVSARTEPRLLEAAEKMRAEHGLDVHPVVANLADEDAVRRLAAEHAARFDRLDVLVARGAVGTSGPTAEFPLKRYDLTFNVNLRSVFLLVQETLPLLRKTAAAQPERGAKIVALSSITGVAAEASMSAYAASKAALISLCESITLDEHAHGVSSSHLPGLGRHRHGRLRRRPRRSAGHDPCRRRRRDGGRLDAALRQGDRPQHSPHSPRPSDLATMRTRGIARRRRWC